MSDEQIAHGFKVVGLTEDGSRSIFVHGFFPENIIDIRLVPSGGTSITSKGKEGEDPFEVKVDATVEQIHALIAECRRLDKQGHE